MCAVTSDCSTVTGFTSCKELTSGGPLTCQTPSTCLATSSCSDEEYCSSTDLCLAAGQTYKKYNGSRNIFLVYCISNTDCESLTGTTVCKETVHGGARTCQASTVCSQVCSYKEFCDAANTCQYGRLQMDAYIIHLKIKFQYTAYQVPIVNLMRYAKKVKLVAHLLARQ